MTGAAGASAEPASMLQRVRQAVIWRSGSHIVSQTIAWGSTFLVIRVLDPADYGLFAMTQVMLVLLNVMNGYGMAGALIRAESVSQRQLSQMFGILLLLNGSLALLQFAVAPLAAAYYRQPMVADLLRVQSLLYLLTPFLALPHAILSRRMDFKRPAQVRLVAALVGALTALACAYGGLGVWTLVAAPIALFTVEAIGLTWVARALMWPTFRFDGMTPLVRYGATLMLVQFFWFLQSQADVFIAGRSLDPHDLGIYTTALFLTQILAFKFVPPLNDVAFAAYSRIQDEAGATGAAFIRAVRLILLVALPAYAGLLVVADPFVATGAGGQVAGRLAPRAGARDRHVVRDPADPVRACHQCAWPPRDRAARIDRWWARPAMRFPVWDAVGRRGACLGLGRRHGAVACDHRLAFALADRDQRKGTP
jgi:O-antigen/teichoic acid export membrane protein